VVPVGAIAVTLPDSSTPLSALIVTVTGWPTLISLMSDSEKETLMVSVLVLTISAKPELELVPVLVEVEPPRLPAVTADPPVLAVEAVEESLVLESLELLDPSSVPIESLDSEAITPAVGA
jgi:hypothetical protein